MPRQTTEQFILQCISDTSRGKRCTGFVLVHVQGPHEQELCVKEVPEKMSVTAAESFAEDLDDTARNYAAGLPGWQQFRILAFWDGKKKPQAVRPFGEAGYSELEGGVTESPNATGIVAQGMRHLEAKGAGYIKAVGILLDAQNDTIRLQNERLNAVTRENVEMFGHLKDLLIQQTRQQNEQSLALAQFQRETEERKALLRAAPGLLNAVTGKEVIPQSVEDSQHMETLIDALVKKGPAALAILETLDLDPKSAFALASRFQRGMKAREAESLARRPVSGLDAEDDVNGGLQ